LKQSIKTILISKTWISCLSVLLIATITLLLRKTDSLLNPQFWAEDGSVFFLQQYEKGASAIFQPYSGYLHLVPRLIALLADTFFPYSEIPFIYNLSSLILTLLVVASVFSPRFKVAYKPLFALTIVLVPHYTNEVFLNITNIQWILAISLIIILMKEKPSRQHGSINLQLAIDFIIIIFCGLTGPFIVFLTPCFIWRWIRDKNSYTCRVMSAVIFFACIQLTLILFLSESTEYNDVNLTLSAFSTILGYRVFGILFFGKSTAQDLNHHLLTAMYFCLCFVILRFSLRKDNLTAYCLVIQFIILLAVFQKFKANIEVLLPVENGARYFYIPHVLLTWSLVALLRTKEKWKNVIITAALTLILFSSSTSDFRSKELIDYNWKLYSQLIGREDVTIPINPKGWQIHLKANLK
jgi:hypothetical protein